MSPDWARRSAQGTEGQEGGLWDAQEVNAEFGPRTRSLGSYRCLTGRGVGCAAFAFIHAGPETPSPLSWSGDLVTREGIRVTSTSVLLLLALVLLLVLLVLGLLLLRSHVTGEDRARRARDGRAMIAETGGEGADR